jgi:hypothetical protein
VSGRALLRWADVLGAVAAEVGEPEGVRTIVFDLLARASRGGLVAVRLDAEPGEPRPSWRSGSPRRSASARGLAAQPRGRRDPDALVPRPRQLRGVASRASPARFVTRGYHRRRWSESKARGPRTRSTASTAA